MPPETSCPGCAPSCGRSRSASGATGPGVSTLPMPWKLYRVPSDPAARSCWPRTYMKRSGWIGGQRGSGPLCHPSARSPLVEVAELTASLCAVSAGIGATPWRSWWSEVAAPDHLQLGAVSRPARNRPGPRSLHAARQRRPWRTVPPSFCARPPSSSCRPIRSAAPLEHWQSCWCPCSAIRREPAPTRPESPCRTRGRYLTEIVPGPMPSV